MTLAQYFKQPVIGDIEHVGTLAEQPPADIIGRALPDFVFEVE